MSSEAPRRAAGTARHAPGTGGLPLVPVLLALTVVSGLVDAVSYLGLHHVFTANMTGNIVILGFAGAGAPGFSVQHTATSLACFLPGAVIGGRFARRLRAGTRPRTWTRTALAMEAVLLGAAAATALAAPAAPARAYVMIGLMACAMGLRNATVRRLGVPDLTTTVMTRTLAGLAADTWLGGGDGRRSARRVQAVTAMLAGATAGAWLVVHDALAVALLIATATTGALALTASGRE
ncbi:YoaK family protein [Streptomyces sp. MS06]|uniref:YoaK family protein n=1 Tax=Streptomyces sp. MS06 TaxID=3385974 RepID=UPI0039A0592F